MEPTLTSVILSHLVRAAGSMGVPTEPLRELIGLTPERWFVFEEHLPLEDAIWLAEHCAGRLGRDFGLRAVTAPGEQYSPVWFLAAARSTLAEAIDDATHYWPLARTDYHWRVEVGRETICNVGEVRPGSLGEAVLLDFDVGSLISSAAVLSGQPFRPLELRMPIPEPDDPRSWLALADRVRFGWPRVEIYSDRRDTFRRLPGHNPTLANFLELRLDGLLAAAAPQQSLSSRARHALRASLSEGGADRATIARSLGVSERTLVRHLQAEGTSYRQLLDAVRFELAACWLADRPIPEVASRLGFADSRSFHRAFRRWSGSTPTQWRRRLEA